MRREVRSSPAQPTPLGTPARRGQEKPAGESALRRSSTQIRPAPTSQSEQGGRQMAGTRGPGSEEAPVAQPTTVPTPTEPILHPPTPRKAFSSPRTEQPPSARPLPSPP